ncbi:UNVERIFIED_ORG: tetratricopeptide (TPR) repeat protein [Arthrobacter sp. UYEF10]
MAEHNGGNRGGNDRGPFRGNNNSGGDPRGFRSREDRNSESPKRAPGSGERKPFSGGGERKPYGDRDNKSFGDRPRREGDGERRTFGGGERKPYGDRDNKSFGDRPRREGDGERRGFSSGGDRKPFSGGGERKPYGDRDNKSFGDRPRREGDGERRGFGGGERKPFSGGGERKPYGDRDNKSFGDRPRREGDGERRTFGGGERKPFGDRQDRAPRSFDRGDSGPRQFGGERAEDRPSRVPNARDLRSANRPDRERSPEIDEDVTGKELDRATQHQIKTLEDKSAEWVARHLVMAGRLIDEEPELAFQHALAASRRGGRLAAVREAVGLTAYAAGHYGEALREFRTYRRISGSNVHLPVMADCERGLGRPDRALDVVRSEEANDLDAPGKVELAIVAAGARSDLGQLDAAVAELEIAQLDINRAFSYSPRLFRAYANALAAVGREDEAAKWQRQAVVAENALGIGADEEPDIVDLGWDEEEEAREEAQRRRLLERAAASPEASASTPAARSQVASDKTVVETAGVDVAIDDVESDFFESDDAESDEDSVEADELEAGDAKHDEEERYAEPTDADDSTNGSDAHSDGRDN